MNKKINYSRIESISALNIPFFFQYHPSKILNVCSIKIIRDSYAEAMNIANINI